MYYGDRQQERGQPHHVYRTTGWYLYIGDQEGKNNERVNSEVIEISGERSALGWRHECDNIRVHFTMKPGGTSVMTLLIRREVDDDGTCDVSEGGRYQITWRGVKCNRNKWLRAGFESTVARANQLRRPADYTTTLSHSSLSCCQLPSVCNHPETFESGHLHVQAQIPTDG